MKCTICETKELSVIIESHHSIEEKPVIICHSCFTKLVKKSVGELLLDKIIKDKNAVQQGKRCSKRNEIITERIR